MIIRVLTALLLAVGGVGVLTGAASASCSTVQQQAMLDGAIQIKTVMHCSGSEHGGVETTVAPPRDSGWDGVCVRAAIDMSLDPATFCGVPSVSPSAATLTPGHVARAFRRLPLPAADLVVQPPNGRTLVNFETNFYTERGEFTRSVRLLGREVELRIWPESFTWRFGDGSTSNTAEPGAPYPDLQVTHRYARKGRVAPSVDVTYAAQFRVGGGAWRDVDGTVTIPGAAESLRVVTARPVLVGG